MTRVQNDTRHEATRVNACRLANPFYRALVDEAAERALWYPIDWARINAEVALLTEDPDHFPGRARRSPPTRRNVLEMWGAACVKCGSAWALERAHVVDQALGGGSTVYDVRPLCVYCHRMQPHFGPDEAYDALSWFYDPATAFWARGETRPELVDAHSAFCNAWPPQRHYWHDRLRRVAGRLAAQPAS